jgi:hypothetical protein
MSRNGDSAAAGTRRRERLLRRTRMISLGIAGGAAAASLGLGAALAQPAAAVPAAGHSPARAGQAGYAGRAESSRLAAPAHAPRPAVSARAPRPARTAGLGPARQATPAAAPAAAHVSSGGS